MAENHFCEEPNCGNPAQVFGFVGRLKRKVCQEHSLILINKQVSLYSITAFAYVQSLEDASLYEQRRRQLERGLGTLTALETACETSWEEEKKQLQEKCEALHAVVQQSYEEMWLKSQQTYEQLKQDIADMRSQFEKLQLYPSFQISPEISDLCDESAPDHLFCVIVGDNLLTVAETLMTNFKVLVWDIKRDKKRDWGIELGQLAINEGAENRFDVAVRAADLARQFGAEVPNFTNEASQQSEDLTQQLRCLFSISTNNEAKECLEIGQTASKTGDFEAGLSALQRGKSILRGSSNWELYLQLSCTLAEIHVHMSHYEDTVEECQHILSTWTPSAHSLDFLQALFYLIYSYNRLDQLSLLLRAQEEWKEKLIVDCSSCQCIQLCIWGLISHITGSVEEGSECIERALQLEHFPSFITLFSKVILAEIYQKQGKLEESQRAYISICELLSVHYPCSLQYANCLSYLGMFYGTIQRPGESEEQYMKAIKLCSTYFPHSIEYANCLLNLGMIYVTRKRDREAEEQWLKAIQVYSNHFPHSIEYALCLSNLGVTYGAMKTFLKSEEHYMKAIQIYSTHFPHSIQYANCLNLLGALYGYMERPRDEEEQYIKAIQVYSPHFPNSTEYAKCLYNLGGVYQAMQRPRETEEQYMKAIQIYSTHFPHSIDYANCLFNLGVLYGRNGRRREALTKIEEARRIYERVGSQEELNCCDESFKVLR